MLGTSNPTRKPTIYDLQKRSIGSNIPIDLISGSRWISPITDKTYNFQSKNAQAPNYTAQQQSSKIIFNQAPKQTQADKIAQAHFKESDKRQYQDFLTSSRTYWVDNAPAPPIEKPILKIDTRKRRMRSPESGIVVSPFSPF